MPGPLIAISDYEERTRKIVHRALFNHDFGTPDCPEWATNTNKLAAFDAIRLRPRVLVNGSRRNFSTTVMGQEISFPLMHAPEGKD